jgi:hypothetical protein
VLVALSDRISPAAGKKEQKIFYVVKLRVAFTASISTKLTAVGQHYVNISYTEFHVNDSKSIEVTGVYKFVYALKQSMTGTEAILHNSPFQVDFDK